MTDDGCTYDGVFYPFLIDGERNPALKWQMQYRPNPKWDWKISPSTAVADNSAMTTRWLVEGTVEGTV